MIIAHVYDGFVGCTSSVIILMGPDACLWIVVALHGCRVVVGHWSQVVIVYGWCGRNGLPCAVGIMTVLDSRGLAGGVSIRPWIFRATFGQVA